MAIYGSICVNVGLPNEAVISKVSDFKGIKKYFGSLHFDFEQKSFKLRQISFES